MMKQEFEALAGYEVSFEDYNKIIEPMYMSTNLSKQEFVQTINRKRFEIKKPTERQLVNQMKKEARHLCDICGHSVDHESQERLESLAQQVAKMNGFDPDRIATGWWFEKEYEYPNGRGCSFPTALVMISGTMEKKINLI